MSVPSAALPELVTRPGAPGSPLETRRNITWTLNNRLLNCGIYICLKYYYNTVIGQRNMALMQSVYLGDK